MEDIEYNIDSSDEEITREQKALIDMHDRIRNIEKSVNIINKDLFNLISHMNNIIFVLNSIENNKIILGNIKTM